MTFDKNTYLLELIKQESRYLAQQNEAITDIENQVTALLEQLTYLRTHVEEHKERLNYLRSQLNAQPC